MALKLRKDIKKSSYYVWFLGAKESKGLRGQEFVIPVIQHLEEREKEVEPLKVTLQVSHKGMKIIQNVLSQPPKSAKPKNETIKHFIPHNTITCVYQKEDIVACILLLFNPVTKCPLHVHAYRCVDFDTATMLKQQLQTLTDRPENQKKFLEIENRLKGPKELKKMDSSVGSDTGASTRESESSEERFGGDTTRVATLYDSVAAELREKLCKNDVPILLPPRDYDTVHRQKGNLAGIELRRCLNTNIVGQNIKATKKIDSSGGSSGIGSDHPPSPDSPDTDTRFNTLDNHSTSDEEWSAEPLADPSHYLITSSSHLTLPRPFKHQEPEYNKPEVTFEPKYKRSSEERTRQYHHEDTQKKYLERQPSRERQRYEDDYKNYRKEEKIRYNKEEPYRSEPKTRYYDDDGFEENTRYCSREKTLDRIKTRYKQDPELEDNRYHPIPKTRQRYPEERVPDKQRYREDPRYISRQSSRCSEDVIEERRRPPELRQRSPSPELAVSPRDRFKDAKEKFLLLERREERTLRKQEPLQKDKTFLKRHESILYPPNYESSRRYDEERPKAAPRSVHSEEIRYRDKFDPKRRSMFNLIEDEHRKNSSEIAKELKRRSYLEYGNYRDELPESDRYLERDSYYSKSSVDLDKIGDVKYDTKFAKNQKVKNAAGYRHSYAEPKLRVEKKNVKHFNEVLHRTNSTVSNGGRIGIASLHPY